MKKRVIALIMAVAMMICLMPITAIARAKTTATVYYDLEEHSSVDSFKEGDNLAFVTVKQNTGSALAALPEGSAELKLVAKINKNTDFAKAFVDLYSLEGAYSEEEFSNVSTAREYLDSQVTTFDDVIGRLQNTSDYVEDIADAKKIVDNELATINALMAKNSATAAEEYAKGTSFGTWSQLEDFLSADIYPACVFSTARGLVHVNVSAEGFDGCVEGLICHDGSKWQYCCLYGGAVEFESGPFYLYTYKTTEVTKDQITLYTKNGFEIPKTGSKVVTNDDCVVSVNIDGKSYDVEFFDILDKNNTVGGNDRTITIDFNGLEVECELKYRPVVDTTKEIAEPDAGKAVDITSFVAKNEDGAKVDYSADIKTTYKLTDEEIANGVWVWTEIEPLDASTVDSSDVKLIEAGLANGQKIGQYLNISLWKQVPGEEAVNVPVSGGDLTVSVKVPAELQNKGYEFAILYTHEGGAAKLVKPISYDSTTGVLVFKASEFSTYALVYTENKDDETIADTDAPDNFASTTTVAVAAIGSVMALGLGLAVVGTIKKRDAE